MTNLSVHVNATTSPFKTITSTRTPVLPQIGSKGITYGLWFGIQSSLIVEIRFVSHGVRFQ